MPKEQTIKPCENKTKVDMRECESCPDFEICYKWDLELERNKNGKESNKI